MVRPEPSQAALFVLSLSGGIVPHSPAALSSSAQVRKNPRIRVKRFRGFVLIPSLKCRGLCSEYG